MVDRVAVAVADKAGALAARFQRRDIGADRVVAGRIGERFEHDRRGADIIGGEIGAAQPLLARGADADHRGVGKPVGAGGPAQFLRALAIGREQRPGDVARQQGADDMPALGGHAPGIDADPGHPHRWRGLLQRPRPDVDVAVVEELALPIERTVGRRHRLQDQIVRLPIAAHQIGRVAVGRCDFVGRALDQAHFQPAARQYVEPRHLLGDAHRVGAVGDRRAERQEARALGLAGDNRQRHRHRNRQTGRGAVMLVDHDVEPDLVAQRELVEIAVQQLVADLRIVIAVRQHDPQRAALQPLLPGRVVGHFREIPDAHRVLLSRLPSTKATSLSTKASGCSQCGKWPASGISSSRASGIACRQFSP